MRAIIHRKYGSPEVLELADIPKPTPADDEVLVKVRAASVNSWDYEILRGNPFANRMMNGVFKPRRQVLGADVAGVVEAIGSNVTRFKPGDEVYGDISSCGWSGFAEYVHAPASAFTPKPPSITFEQAAAVPQAAVMAFQALRIGDEIQPGDSVLINGAGGGVGTFAVQMARTAGAVVTGVDLAEKFDTMRSAGAEHVIDYKQEDFTRSGRRYDLVIDCSLHHWLSGCRRVLNPGGTYVLIGGSSTRIMVVSFLSMFLSKFSSKKVKLLIYKPSADDLASVGELLESDEIAPVIDRSYPLEELPDAFRYFSEGRVRGKLVITF